MRKFINSKDDKTAFSDIELTRLKREKLALQWVANFFEASFRL